MPAKPVTRRQVLAGSAVLALAGCSRGADTPAAATRTVRGDFGDVQVPVAPRRVVAATGSDADVALVLDLPLVAAPGARGAANRPFPPYQPADRLRAVARFGIYPELQVERVSAQRPDLILNGGNTVPEYHDQLSRVAPTLSYSAQLFTDWRDGLRYVADAFARRDVADRAVAAYDDRTAALRPRVLERFPGARVAMIYPAGAGAFTVYARGAQTLATAVDAGFTLADVTPESFDAHQEYSLERVGVLGDADVLLLFLDVNTEDATAGTLERDRSGYAPIVGSALWAQLPAVRAGQVYEVPAELAYASPLTAPANLDLIEDVLLAG